MITPDLGLQIRQIYAITNAFVRTGYVEEAPRNELAGALDAIHDIAGRAYSELYADDEVRT